MQKFISFLICVFALISLNAQWYVKPRSISTDLNSCNNIAVCEIYGVTSPGFVYLHVGPSPGFVPPVLISDGDTLIDYCFYDVGTNGSHELAIYNSNGYVHQFLTYSTLITEDFNYDVSSYTPPTNEVSMDGSMTITFDSAVTSYTLQAEQNNLNYPAITIVDPYTLNLNGINEGYITFYIQNPVDIYDYAIFRIFAGDPYDAYFVDSLNTGISFQHANSGCDGWINIQPLNAVGTVYNAWSDNTTNELTRTNLCPGVYGVYTYELVGSSYSGSIDTIVITNDNTTFIDSSLFSIVPQDTSYYFEDACTFDYGLPIDSVHYSEDTVFFSGGLLIATFDMILYQGNNMVTISDSLITLSDSTVLLDVVLYCTLFKSDDFLGRRIMFLRGVDNHFFTQPNMASVTEFKEEQKPRIYPVPAQNLLTIDFVQSGDYKITVLDYQGRIYNSLEVTQTSQVTLATESLPIGAYVLVVESDQSVEKYRFVKGTN